VLIITHVINCKIEKRFRAIKFSLGKNRTS